MKISKQQQQQKQQKQQQITANTTHYYQTLKIFTQYCPSIAEKMNVNQPLKNFPLCMETYSVLLCSKESTTEHYDVQAARSQHHYDLFILKTILISSFYLCLHFPRDLFPYDL
jgi:hypothetical protein